MGQGSFKEDAIPLSIVIYQSKSATSSASSTVFPLLNNWTHGAPLLKKVTSFICSHVSIKDDAEHAIRLVRTQQHPNLIHYVLTAKDSHDQWSGKQVSFVGVPAVHALITPLPSASSSPSGQQQSKEDNTSAVLLNTFSPSEVLQGVIGVLSAVRLCTEHPIMMGSPSASNLEKGGVKTPSPLPAYVELRRLSIENVGFVPPNKTVYGGRWLVYDLSGLVPAPKSMTEKQRLKGTSSSVAFFLLELIGKLSPSSSSSVSDDFWEQLKCQQQLKGVLFIAKHRLKIAAGESKTSKKQSLTEIKETDENSEEAEEESQQSWADILDHYLQDCQDYLTDMVSTVTHLQKIHSTSCAINSSSHKGKNKENERGGRLFPFFFQPRVPICQTHDDSPNNEGEEEKKDTPSKEQDDGPGKDTPTKEKEENVVEGNAEAEKGDADDAKEEEHETTQKVEGGNEKEGKNIAEKEREEEEGKTKNENNCPPVVSFEQPPNETEQHLIQLLQWETYMLSQYPGIMEHLNDSQFQEVFLGREENNNNNNKNEGLLSLVVVGTSAWIYHLLHWLRRALFPDIVLRSLLTEATQSEEVLEEANNDEERGKSEVVFVDIVPEEADGLETSSVAAYVSELEVILFREAQDPLCTAIQEGLHIHRYSDETAGWGSADSGSSYSPLRVQQQPSNNFTTAHVEDGDGHLRLTQSYERVLSAIEHLALRNSADVIAAKACVSSSSSGAFGRKHRSDENQSKRGKGARQQEEKFQRQEEHEKFRARIVVMYEKYCPEKLPNVDMILERYEGLEEKLMEALTLKYGPEPSAREGGEKEVQKEEKEMGINQEGEKGHAEATTTSKQLNGDVGNGRQSEEDVDDDSVALPDVQLPEKLHALNIRCIRERILPWLLRPCHLAQSASAPLFTFLFENFRLYAPMGRSLIPPEKMHLFIVEIFTSANTVVRLAALPYLPYLFAPAVKGEGGGAPSQASALLLPLILQPIPATMTFAAGASVIPGPLGGGTAGGGHAFHNTALCSPFLVTNFAYVLHEYRVRYLTKVLIPGGGFGAKSQMSAMMMSSSSGSSSLSKGSQNALTAHLHAVLNNKYWLRDFKSATNFAIQHIKALRVLCTDFLLTDYFASIQAKMISSGLNCLVAMSPVRIVNDFILHEIAVLQHLLIECHSALIVEGRGMNPSGNNNANKGQMYSRVPQIVINFLSPLISKVLSACVAFALGLWQTHHPRLHKTTLLYILSQAVYFGSNEGREISIQTILGYLASPWVPRLSGLPATTEAEGEPNSPPLKLLNTGSMEISFASPTGTTRTKKPVKKVGPFAFLHEGEVTKLFMPLFAPLVGERDGCIRNAASHVVLHLLQLLQRVTGTIEERDEQSEEEEKNKGIMQTHQPPHPLLLPTEELLIQLCGEGKDKKVGPSQHPSLPKLPEDVNPLVFIHGFMEYFQKTLLPCSENEVELASQSPWMVSCGTCCGLFINRYQKIWIQPHTPGTEASLGLSLGLHTKDLQSKLLPLCCWGYCVAKQTADDTAQQQPSFGSSAGENPYHQEGSKEDAPKPPNSVAKEYDAHSLKIRMDHMMDHVVFPDTFY